MTVKAAPAPQKPRRRHGLGASGVSALIARQGGACAICRVPFEDVPGKRPSIDHDHRHCAGKIGCVDCVRGALCLHCNNILRLANDQPATLLAAVSYLAAPPHKPGEGR